MRLFAHAPIAQAAERRAASRLRVDCLATLLMPSGNRPGRLFDISTEGARFVTEVPPAQGVAAILDWTLYESYCHVMWTRPGMCGVKFDRPLHSRVLEDLAAATRVNQRAANPANSNSTSTAPTRFVC